MRLLEFLAGVGPDSDRLCGWFDEHPGAALAVMALGALASVTADGWWS